MLQGGRFAEKGSVGKGSVAMLAERRVGNRIVSGIAAIRE